jgi:signal peptidase I
MNPRRKRQLAVISIALLVLLIVPAYLKAYALSGASDAPTLLLGDKAIVNYAAYRIHVPYTRIQLCRIARPRRGDMVLVQRPDNPARAFKRVIGLPGETVEMRDNRIIVDGRLLPLKPLPRAAFSWVPAERHKMGSTVFDEDGHWVAFTPGSGTHRDFGPLHLGAREYFLLGDNRDNSLDCRFWGPIRESAIFGKLILTMASGPRLK